MCLITLQNSNRCERIQIHFVKTFIADGWRTCFANHLSDKLHGDRRTTEHSALFAVWQIRHDDSDCLRHWRLACVDEHKKFHDIVVHVPERYMLMFWIVLDNVCPKQSKSAKTHLEPLWRMKTCFPRTDCLMSTEVSRKRINKFISNNGVRYLC